MTTELSDRARALLDSARNAPVEADAEAVARMEKAVLVATGAAAATTAAGATAAAKSAAGVTLTTKLIIVSSLAVVVAAGTALTFSMKQHEPVAPAPPVLVTPTPQPVTPAPAPQVVVEPPAPPVVTAPVIAPRVVKPAVAPAVPEVAKPPEPPPPAVLPPQSASELARELALLGVAKTALTENRFSDVLASIDQHDVEFPNGTLGVEAEVLRILALCEVGRANEAMDRSAKLRASSKPSPALSRLGGSCVDP